MQATCGWYFFYKCRSHSTGQNAGYHGTQTNKKDQKCLLALNPNQNVVLDGRKTVWFSCLPIKQWPLIIITCEIWPVEETSPASRNLSHFHIKPFDNRKHNVLHWLKIHKISHILFVAVQNLGILPKNCRLSCTLLIGTTTGPVIIKSTCFKGIDRPLPTSVSVTNSFSFFSF